MQISKLHTGIFTVLALGWSIAGTAQEIIETATHN